MILFGDTGPNKNKYIVHTWHRTARIEDGKIVEVVYGHSYPAYPPAREDPNAGGVLSRAAGLCGILGRTTARFRSSVASAERLG